jgi:MFS family permease
VVSIPGTQRSHHRNIDVGPDFVMTIPLVSLVEHYGRRPILWLNLIPRIAVLSWTFIVGYFEEAIPTSAIMASPFLSVFGGDCVFNSITYALVAGLTDDYVQRFVKIVLMRESNPHLTQIPRATYFSQMNAISSIFAYQLGPALASATMSVLLWLPFWIGILLLLLAVPIISALPSGLSTDRKGQGDDEAERAALLSSPLLKAQDQQPSVLATLKARLQTIREILNSHPRNFALLLACFFLTSLASSDTKMFTQYISKRYNWKFASVGYLLSGKALFNFFYLTFFIPMILRLRARKRSPSTPLGQSSSAADAATMSYAKICFVVSGAGALAIALAWTFWLLIPALLLYALGIALPVFTYSLLKSPSISPRHSPGETDSAAHVAGSETQIFSIVMLVKTTGLLVGTPLMATLWVKGIGIGGSALGLPFFVSAATYLVAMGVFSYIKIADGR